jgi:hypothetical protein
MLFGAGSKSIASKLAPTCGKYRMLKSRTSYACRSVAAHDRRQVIAKWSEAS